LYYKNPPKSVLLFLKLLGLLAVVAVFSLGIVNLFDGYLPLDLDPVIYPQIQVLSGKNLLAPVTSFYGLYAFFLQPIFKLIGFSVLKFSLVMSSLMLLSFWFLKKMLRRAVENTTIYLLGFLAIVFLHCVSYKNNAGILFSVLANSFYISSFRFLPNYLVFKK
jgi:hypothetical protein